MDSVSGSGEGSGHDDDDGPTGTISGTVFFDTDCNGINGEFTCKTGSGSGSGSGKSSGSGGSSKDDGSGSGKASGSGSGKDGSGSGSGSGKASGSGSGKASGSGSCSGSGDDDDCDTVYTPEPTKAGVLIKLLDLDGNVVAETTTDAHGNYKFENVPVGDYKIMGVAPDGTKFTIQDVEGNSKDDIDSDVDETGTSDVIHVTKGSKTDIDLGVCKTEPGSLSGRYFCDTNNNDVDDGQATDPGVAGVVVTLFDAAGNEVATTTTGAEGEYSFTGLEPGTYSVQFTDPDGVLAGKQLVQPNVEDQTTPEGTGDEIDSDAIGDTTLSTIDGIVVEENKDTPDNDAGAEYTAALGDKVFFDDNRDGIQDPGEAGVSGVTVTLTGGGADKIIGTADDTSATATTDANGEYLFEGLDPGTEYKVTFSGLPAGTAFTTPDQGGDDAADSDADPANGMTGIYVLAPGEENLTVDAGIVSQLGSISGRYFLDDGPDPAKDCDGLDNDFVTESTETAIAGARVVLIKAGVGVIASTTTDDNGDYAFTGLEAGDYRVRFIAVDGTEFTDPNVGADDTIDSDVTVVGTAGNGNTDFFSLAPGEDKTDVDAGVCTLRASLGDFVFEDLNANGIQDAGETGIAGVTVNLLDDLDGDGQIDDVAATTTTDANGNYAFTDLEPGDYRVQFVQPSGFTEVSPANVGGDDSVDSDGLVSDVVSLDPGENDPTIDQGFYNLASLGDFVFEDLNGDGIQDAGEPGVEGVTVKLFKDGVDTGKTTTTDANGAYSFTGLVPGTYSVMFVAPTGFAFTTANAGTDDALDSDANPANGMTQTVTLTSGEFNGTLDAGLVAQLGSIAGRYFVDAGDPPDPARDCDGLDNDGDGTPESSAPVVGATVELLNAAGVVIATTTTGANGEYLFTGLAAGDYSVRFAPTPDAKFTDPNVGADDTIDSDVNPTTGETGTISLAPGQSVTDVDAGICPLASLGDTVFLDANANGIQDPGEVGIAGVTVNLLDDLDGDGQIDDVAATTTTDANGNYAFTDLEPGDYRVEFVAPAGFVASPANVGGDDAADSDGVLDGGTFRTGVISLDPGETDPTNDQGFYNLASLGDFVWQDLDGDGTQDAGEPGVPGVTVQLKDAGGTVIATTTTDATGKYNFSNLVPGTYSVAFIAPAGFAFTTANAGTDDALDSDADPTNGMTQQVTLASGEFNGTLDAGLVALNNPPEPNPDMAKTCADELVTVDVLANDGDPDGDTLTIVEVDGQAISEGGSVTTGVGTVVSLVGGELVFDGEIAYAALDIGEEATEVISYAVSDGKGGTATTDVTVTFCGDANSVASLGESLPDGQFSLQTLDETWPNGTFPGELPIDPTLPVTPNHEEWTIKLSGSGDARFDGVIFDEAYCLESETPALAGRGRGQTDIDFAPKETVTMSLLDDTFDFAADGVPGAPGLSNGEIANAINWILNQDFNGDPAYAGLFTDGGLSQPDVTDAEIQAAIWGLTDDDLFLPTGRTDLGQIADAQKIFDLALANTDFEVGIDDKIGVLLEPVDGGQPFVLAIDFDAFDCLC